MKRNNRCTIPLLTMLLLAVANSCVEDELHDTPHPGTGQVAVTADWSGRGEEVEVPAEWNVAMGEYSGKESGERHVAGVFFEPGDYTLAAYNAPEGITIEGTIATVAPEAGDGEGTFVTGAPGWLLTAVREVSVEADTDHEVSVVMQQQVRQLTLVIEATGDAAERVEAIEGRLSGVAGTLDFATGTHGKASEVGLHFTRIMEGEDAGKWRATARLLGVTGEQWLRATLSYAEGNPGPTSMESDLTGALKAFNGEKDEPLVLGGRMVETPTEAGVEAGITGWETIDGGGVDAEM